MPSMTPSLVIMSLAVCQVEGANPARVRLICILTLTASKGPTMKAPITPDPRPARECDRGVGAESLWSFKFGKLNKSVKLGSQELLVYKPNFGVLS